MRSKLIGTGVVFAVALLCLFSGMLLFPRSALAQPQSYPLVCRGGGNMLFQHDFGSAGAWVRFRFTKGNAPAGGGAKLSPGSCSWVDRGINAAEPDHTCAQQLKGSHIHWRVPGTFLRAASSDAPYLEALQDPNRTFFLRVYNTGGRFPCFRITGYGP